MTGAAWRYTGDLQSSEDRSPLMAGTVTIYHNPRCTKSRQTLELLRSRGIEPTIVEYLKTPPDAAELKRLLGLTPRQLMRRKEAAEAGLDDPSLSDEAVIAG